MHVQTHGISGCRQKSFSRHTHSALHCPHDLQLYEARFLQGFESRMQKPQESLFCNQC